MKTISTLNKKYLFVIIILQLLTYLGISEGHAQKKDTVTIRSYVDGSDFVHIKRNQVWYVHRKFDLPGRWNGANEPTYVNGIQWFPVWRSAEEGAQSSFYNNLAPPLPGFGLQSTVLQKIAARISIEYIQAPEAGNDYEAIVLLNDDPFDGPDWYEFRLIWSFDTLGRCCIYRPNMETDCKDKIGVNNCIKRFIASGVYASDVLWSRSRKCENACPPAPALNNISLKSFNGSYNSRSQSIELNWQIPSEVSNVGFFVERSNDGKKFKKIGFVNPTKHEGDANTYRFTDINPYDNGYYKVVQLLDNGSLTYSQVVNVNKQKANSLRISPNPSSDRIKIELSELQFSDGYFSILDLSGKVIERKYISRNSYWVDISGLTKGKYVIQLEIKGKNYSASFIKN